MTPMCAYPSGSVSLLFTPSSRKKRKKERKKDIFSEQVFCCHPFGSGGNGHSSVHINSLLVHGTQVYPETITDHLFTLTYTPSLV